MYSVQCFLHQGYLPGLFVSFAGFVQVEYNVLNFVHMLQDYYGIISHDFKGAEAIFIVYFFKLLEIIPIPSNDYLSPRIFRTSLLLPFVLRLRNGQK